LAFFHGFDIRFHVESATAFPWITRPDSVEYTEASKLWRKQLGDRFPAIKKAVHINQQLKDVAKLSTVYVTKNPPKPWGQR